VRANCAVSISTYNLAGRYRVDHTVSIVGCARRSCRKKIPIKVAPLRGVPPACSCRTARSLRSLLETTKLLHFGLMPFRSLRRQHPRMSHHGRVVTTAPLSGCGRDQCRICFTAGRVCPNCTCSCRAASSGAQELRVRARASSANNPIVPPYLTPGNCIDVASPLRPPPMLTFTTLWHSATTAEQ
jgi:hypothetical protein